MHRASNRSDKFHFYLHGPAGFGKTTSIKNFCEKIGLELIYIKLSSSFEDSFRSEKIPGVLLSKIANAKSKKAVLFFDDAGEALNSKNPDIISMLKNILEPTLGVFDSKFLNYSILLKSFLIVATGNVPIEDPALLTRFINIPFPTFRAGYLQKYFMDQYQSSLLGGTGLEGIVYGVLESNPGIDLRTLQQKMSSKVSSTVRHLRKRK